MYSDSPLWREGNEEIIGDGVRGAKPLSRPGLFCRRMHCVDESLSAGYVYSENKYQSQINWCELSQCLGH